MFFLLKGVNKEYAEWFYTSEGEQERGCIGHLRFDFGHGEEFYTTFWPHPENEVNSPGFSEELDNVINFLRRKGRPLFNLREAGRLCWTNEEYRLSDIDPYYGFMVETEGFLYMLRLSSSRGWYLYMLRLSSSRGWYSYVYCFDKKKMAAEIGIPEGKKLEEKR